LDQPVFRMKRRDFLHPRQIAQTAGAVLDVLEGENAPAPPPANVQATLLRAARQAMATQFELVLPYGMPDALVIAETIFDEIDQLEQQLTVYRTTSEISRLNALAPFAAVPVEEKLFDLLALAGRIWEQTESAYDITAGALIKAWGFYRGPRRVPTECERLSALKRVGMRHVELQSEPRTVRYLRRGLEINLGSIGKGYALDQAASLLRCRWNRPAALLHGGHSSVYAIGSEPGTTRGWPIGIGHPWEKGRRLAMVYLRDRALGTSAATFQHLEHEGRKLGHILDPRTGWPAEGIALASVLAPTAAEADALSTAFFILGVDKARGYCARHPEIGAILVPEETPASPVIIGLNANEVSICDSGPAADLQQEPSLS
jgi:thiamine biosynthesis lipoprotein